MTTRSPAALEAIYTALKKSGQYPSMRRSGIVGDLAHRMRGGYHISRSDQPSTNYSVQAPADKRGRSDLASAIDIGLNPAEMRKMTTRLLNACKANHANPAREPRIECVREHQGTIDGKRVTGWNRYDTGRDVGYITGSSSHLWHEHISIFRDYADDPAKIKGLIDILLGVPLKPPPPPPKPKPEEKPTVVKPTINLEDVEWIWTTQAVIPAGSTETDPAKKFWQPRSFLRMTFDKVHELLGKADETLALLREIRDELKARPEDPQP